MKLLLSFMVFLMAASSFSALLPETYRAKSSRFYLECHKAKRHNTQFQEHIRSLLIRPLPKAVRYNINSFLAEESEYLSDELTLGAFNTDLVALAFTNEPLMHSLNRINKRLADLFLTFKVPFSEQNADLFVPFLTFTILSINSPVIYSTLETLSKRNEKNQIEFTGDEPGMMEYLVVTLAIANASALKILHTWADSFTEEVGAKIAPTPTLASRLAQALKKTQ